MKATAVLISGSGTNLQAIIDRWKQGGVHYNLALVISNVATAPGLAKAQAAGIQTLVIDHKAYASREEFDQALDAALRAHQIELIALAGFMRLLSAGFVQAWSGRMINIHPSLLPAFPGLHTHQKALDYGVRFAGCSVIFVDGGVDSGAIIEQAVVPVLAGDTAQTLAARVLQQEHLIFPQALEDLALGKVWLEEGKVRRKEEHEPN